MQKMQSPKKPKTPQQPTTYKRDYLPYGAEELWADASTAAVASKDNLKLLRRVSFASHYKITSFSLTFFY